MPLNTRGMLRSLLPALVVVTPLVACSTKVVVPPEPPKSVRRGDEAFHYREYDVAIGNYRTYLDRTEHGPYTVRSFYKCALAAYYLGRYHLTLATLDELGQRYPEKNWVQADTLRGDAEHALGNNMQALQAWDAAWKIANDSDQQILRQRIVDLARDLDTAELGRARRLVTTKGVVRLLDQEMAKQQAPANVVGRPESKAELEEPFEPEPPRQVVPPRTSKTGREQAAPGKAAVVAPEEAETESLGDIETEPLAPDKVPAPDELRPEVPASEEAIRGNPKVGCLLPMTGPRRDVGERALRGIRLAFGKHSPPLLLKDTGTASALAVSGLDDLSRDANVLAVIGRLSSDATEAVAMDAERSGLPLFLLSQSDGLNGQFLLQVGTTRSRLIASLVDYAVVKARLRRFGVLYPNDAYGKEFLTAFRTEADRRGGQIIGAAAYPPGASSLGAEVSTLRKWRDSQNLQAIFLADGPTQAAGLATFLQREMPDVTLLGPYGWEGLADGGEGTALNGVVFADGFYADSERPATREFVQHFQEAYGQTPGLVEAQAYDAALLVKRALDAGARSRADVLRRLRGVGSLGGATGDLLVTPAGFEGSSFLLQVYDGRLQEIGANEG